MRKNERLTKRELEVLKLMQQGLGADEAALQLGVSKRTLLAHSSAIYRKFSLTSPFMLATMGLPGLIRLRMTEISRSEWPGIDWIPFVISLDAPDTLGPLPREVERTLYGVVDDALADLTRQTGPGRCLIRLVPRDRGITLSIELDGNGLPAGFRVGDWLQRARERVEVLGGTFVVESHEATDNRIVVDVPFDQENVQ